MERNQMKLWLVICFSLLSLQTLYSQKIPHLTLDSCLILAERNYPQIQQYDLINQSTEYSLVNAQKAKLPQITIIGQASYQSEVTSFPGGGGVSTPELSKDQYRLYGEIVQPLTGLAVVNQQKKIIKAEGAIQQANLELKMYTITQRVSDLFFGILLIQGKWAQSGLTKADLEAGLSRIRAAVKYGAALKSSADVLTAQLMFLEQRLIEQQATRAGYLNMLGLFIGRTLEGNTKLSTPIFIESSTEIVRPELNFFNQKMVLYDLQSELIGKNNLPQFSLFLQTGIGRPALNVLSNDFEPYYIGGLKLSWKLSNFYTSGRKRELLNINKSMVQSERETFLFNTRLMMTNQDTQINKMKQLIEKDQEIIELRDRIVRTSKGQLENGIITSSAYKTTVIDADDARQRLALHAIELLKLRNDLNITSGN